MTDDDTPTYTRREVREACENNYRAGWDHAVEWLLQQICQLRREMDDNGPKGSS